MAICTRLMIGSPLLNDAQRSKTVKMGKLYLEFLLVEVTDDQDEHRFTVILELGTDFVTEQ